MDLLWLSFWGLSQEMGIYILFGLLVAGVLHQFVREEAVRRHLGANTHNAVLKAALIGAPLPLCSCSVIPFAASIRKSGASKGSTLAFLISTPITGVDSILATFGMFGWAFTLYRLITSVIIALTAGMVMNILEPKTPPSAVKFSAAPSSLKPNALQPSMETIVQNPPFSIKAVFTYGFGTLLSSFSKPLFWGLLIGAIISAAMPTNLQELFNHNRIYGYLISVAIAAPMYVCATASLPIAASLMLAGVSPGAAFIFLSAGPATNTVTMGVVKSMLGMRALIVYLSVIMVGSILFGALIDWGFDSLSVQLSMGMHEHHAWWDQVSAVLLLGLIAWHFVSGWFKKEEKSCSGGSCCL